MTRYSQRLYPRHAELLAGSAVAPDVADERGYRTVETKADLERLGFGRAQRIVPTLLVPVYDETGTVALHQHRPDEPRRNGDGKPIKYETPAGARMVVDVPPRVRPQLGDPAVPLWVTEGVRKADAAVSAGLACVALLGVWNWRGANADDGKTALAVWESVALKDRQVYVAFDSDVMLKDAVRKALVRLGAFLTRRGASVAYVYLPAGPGGTKTGLDDHFARGGTVDELLLLARREPIEPELPDDDGPDSGPLPPVPPKPPPKRRDLADVVATFRRWLHLDDPAPVYAVAATIAANRAAGDPVWLLIVSAPSTGKTELLSAAAGLPYVRSVATLTASALLSGTSRRERTKDATGGVLRQVGDFGILLAKDFTSVLAQNRDTRAEALAALREVYDGEWHRAVGTDGGRILSWRGKCGLLGGVTPAFDGYHAVVSTLGDRFLLLRLPDVDPKMTGAMALTHRGREAEMRAELGAALAGLVEHLDVGKVNRPLSNDERGQLVGLATFTARARTGVARDGYHEDVLYLPQVEGPGRLVLAYARLLGGLEAIGCDETAAWSVLGRVAVDCMPSTRARLARVLLDEAPADLLDQRPSPIKTSDAAAQIGMTTKNARKHLEDLALLGMADRSKTSDADNAADLWAASAWLHDYWPRAERRCTSPPPTPEGGGLADASAETTPLRTSPSRSEPVPGRSALWLAQHPEEANA